MNIKKIVGALLCSLAVTTAFAQQPYGGCWHPDYIKDWTPEKDPDAKFNRSTVKLQPRIEGDNIKAHQYQFPEGQVAACLTMNPMCSMTPSQGANNFIGYTPTYWQYIDMVIWWGGSAGEGIIVPPSAPVIDACHMNGVKILGNVFFPPQAYSGDPEWVEQMLTKEGNTYPYAEKMYEIAKYYGFDGWFINEETYASTASDWVEWIKYFYQCAEADGNHDMYIQWYDASMYVNNALDIMMANPNTSFFANYGSAGKVTIEQNRSRMENAGVDMDAFFEKLYSGIGQAQGGLIGNAQNLQACFPKTGHASSMQIFNPEEPIWKKVVEGILDTENNCGPTAYSAMETVFSNEARFWTNAQNNPADITDRDQTYPNPWPGLANAIQERSTIQSKPFVTAFSTGLGKHRFVNGEKRGTQDWYHRGMQNILPTWRWWVETTSSDKLTFSLNWDDAYNFGTSVVVSGKLTANADHLTRLYKTNIAIENGDKVQLVYKTANAGTIELKLADKTNPSSFTTFALNPTSTSNGWTIAEADISSITVKAGYSLGGAAKEDNFNIAFVSENENIATVSDLQVSDDDTYTFTVNGGSEVGKTNITATMTNGEYQKSVSFAVTTFDASMINLISHMSPSSAQEGTDKPTINDKGTLANLTDGNHSTAYLPDFYAAAGQSVRFVYTFDAPKSVSRFQAYFLEPDNIESALPTEVKFEVSENGTDFDVVNTAAAGTDVSYNLPEARDAKAVAFTIGLGLWMTTPIAELEVYGKDGTAIDEITVSRVLVAPNPVNQSQKMAVAADQAESIEIYSMQGALVKAERAEETITFVSTDDLTPGIYFMVVKGADYTETVKVIVK